MNKIIFICSIAAVLSFGSFIKNVDAHMLKIDGNINGVLHIDPEDDPIINEPAFIHISVLDKAKTFTFNECDCKLTIAQGGKIVFTQQVTNDNALTYIFPERALYTIVITGKPKTNALFQPFTLSYDIRVSRTSSTPPSTMNMPMTFKEHLAHHFWHIVLVFAMVIALIIIYITDKRKITKK